jgi:YVTN family beta-propeller protein
LITLQRTPTGLAYGENAVWVANGLLGTVQRVDPEFNTVDDPIETGVSGASTASVAVGFGSVWFASVNSNVVRLDPSTGRSIATLSSGFQPSGIAVDSQSVWVANRGENSVYRFSPTTNKRIKEFSVSAGPAAIVTGAGAVWVAAGEFNSVTRVDPLSGSTLNIPVGRRPSALAYGAGAVWVANGGDGTISRIDPATNNVTATIHVGNVPAGVAVRAGLVWVAVQAR